MLSIQPGAHEPPNRFSPVSDNGRKQHNLCFMEAGWEGFTARSDITALHTPFCMALPKISRRMERPVSCIYFKIVALRVENHTKEEFATWSLGTFLTGAVWVTAPTGDYDKNRVINIGSNRWAFKPELAFGTPIGPTWLEFDKGPRDKILTLVSMIIPMIMLVRIEIYGVNDSLGLMADVRAIS